MTLKYDVGFLITKTLHKSIANLLCQVRQNLIGDIISSNVIKKFTPNAICDNFFTCRKKEKEKEKKKHQIKLATPVYLVC